MALMNELSRYQVLVDLARSLGRAMELHTLLDEILRRSQEVLASEACSIFLPDKENGDLIIHSALGDKAPMLAATRIPKGQGVAGAVYESRKPLNISDAQNDPRFYGKVDAKTGFITKSLLTVPLLNGQEVIGVLQAINALGRASFDKIDEEICEAFSGLVVSALIRLEAEKRQMDEIQAKQELELAKEIQRSFLPGQDIFLPTCHVYSHYAPAKAVGGDFCLVYPLGKGSLLIGLGDVSGKGVPAALSMARATATIKALVPNLDHDLASWATHLNKCISEDLRAGRFIAIAFLYFDVEKQRVQICSAGQCAPFHGKRAAWNHLSLPRQLPMGIFQGTVYQAQDYPLESGESWLVFSDGVSEARNPHGEDLGEDAFLQALPTNVAPRKMFEGAVEKLNTFVADAPQHDDITLLYVDWRGTAPPAIFEHQCCPENCSAGRNFIESWCEYLGLGDITTGKIVLACDEATTNIFRHAYESKPGPIRIEIETTEEAFTITMIDQGKTVDTSKIRSRELDDIRPGGLGIYLIKSVFEEVSYIPQEVGTRLVMKYKPSKLIS